MHEAVVKTIKYLMDKNGMTCYAMSLSAGLDRNCVAKIIFVKQKPIYPSFITIVKICKACNITLEDFGRLYHGYSELS